MFENRFANISRRVFENLNKLAWNVNAPRPFASFDHLAFSSLHAIYRTASH